MSAVSVSPCKEEREREQARSKVPGAGCDSDAARAEGQGAISRMCPVAEAPVGGAALGT